MPKTWLDIVDELYQGSWNDEPARFRSPFAFRGVSSGEHSLDSSLVRLARRTRRTWGVSRALLRNFRKYARGHAAGRTRCGTGWRLASIAVFRRGSSTGPTHRSWRFISPRKIRSSSTATAPSGA